MISYICASNNEKILYANLMRSKVAKEQGVYVEDDCKNVPKAYNWLSAGKGMCCFVHHDVFLPDSFEYDLNIALKAVPDDWGVLGPAGVRLIDGKKFIRGHILDRGKQWGGSTNIFNPVDTIDELLLITRGDLKFDENLPFDFYGADVCLQARKQGRNCYAINAYVEHNSTRPIGGRTESFYKSQEYFREKWKEYLPVVTTCCLIENV